MPCTTAHDGRKGKFSEESEIDHAAFMHGCYAGQQAHEGGVQRRHGSIRQA